MGRRGLDAEDEFWHLFADPPCYQVSPWKSITQLDRSHTMLTLSWILQTPILMADFYNVLSDSFHKEAPFKLYLSGEHAVNTHLKREFNFPKQFAYKTIDVHFDFTQEFDEMSPKTSSNRFTSLQVRDLLQNDIVPADTPFSIFFEKNEAFSKVGNACGSRVEEVSRWLSKVLIKHQTLIRSRLNILKLHFVRVHVLRDVAIHGVPLKTTRWRVGLEIHNPSTDTLFFWSLFTLHLDWQQALTGLPKRTQRVTLVNILSEDIKPSEVCGFNVESVKPEDHDGFTRPVNELYIDTINLLDVDELRNDLKVIESNPKDYVPRPNEKHFDGLSSNPSCSFLLRRHGFIKDLWTWCEENSELITSDPKAFINDLEDMLEVTREKFREAEAEGRIEAESSDFWFREYENYEFDEEENAIKRKRMKTIRNKADQAHSERERGIDVDNHELQDNLLEVVTSTQPQSLVPAWMNWESFQTKWGDYYESTSSFLSNLTEGEFVKGFFDRITGNG